MVATYTTERFAWFGKLNGRPRCGSVQENPVLHVPFDGPRQHEAFHIAPRITRSSVDIAWLTRATSCSMIGPSSSTGVT